MHARSMVVSKSKAKDRSSKIHSNISIVSGIVVMVVLIVGAIRVLELFSTVISESFEWIENLKVFHGAPKRVYHTNDSRPFRLPPFLLLLE